MAKSNQKRGSPSTNTAPPAVGRERRVGWRNPPKHTQFQKGVSGNKKGRPKGSKNLSTLLMEAANKHVMATIGGKPQKITTLQATAMQLAMKAAQGNEGAMSKLLSWIDELERRHANAERSPPYPFDNRDLEVLRATYERMMTIKSQQEEN